jgi:hypothetical protein
MDAAGTPSWTSAPPSIRKRNPQGLRKKKRR